MLMGYRKNILTKHPSVWCGSGIDKKKYLCNT